MRQRRAHLERCRCRCRCRIQPTSGMGTPDLEFGSGTCNSPTGGHRNGIGPAAEAELPSKRGAKATCRPSVFGPTKLSLDLSFSPHLAALLPPLPALPAGLTAEKSRVLTRVNRKQPTKNKKSPNERRRNIRVFLQSSLLYPNETQPPTCSQTLFSYFMPRDRTHSPTEKQNALFSSRARSHTHTPTN